MDLTPLSKVSQKTPSARSTQEGSKEQGQKSLENKEEPASKAARLKDTFKTSLGDLGAVVSAIPDVMEPTIVGADAATRERIIDSLDQLPAHIRRTAKVIQVVEDIPLVPFGPYKGNNPSGFAFPLPPGSSHIALQGSEIRAMESAQELVSHEVGHTVDYDAGLFGMVPGHSLKTRADNFLDERLFGKGEKVSQYAEQNPLEDFAETYSEQINNGHKHGHSHGGDLDKKLEYVEELNEPSLLQRLYDNDATRETGRWIADHTEAGYGVGRHLIHSSMLINSVVGGIGDFQKAKKARKEGDSQAIYQAQLGTISNTLLATGTMSIHGLAFRSVLKSLDREVAKGTINADDVAGTIGFSKVVNQRLQEQGYKPQKALVSGIALGSMAGGTLGALTGPALGIQVGHAVAGGAGGAIGMVAGAIGGIEVGSRLGSWLGKKAVQAVQ